MSPLPAQLTGYPKKGRERVKSELRVNSQKTAPLRARFEGGRIRFAAKTAKHHQAIMDESDINSVLFLFLQAMNFIVPITVLALADEVIE